MLENDEEITQLIRRLVPINELEFKVQNELIQKADLLELKKGKFLFQKGEQDNYSYFLLDGEIDLLADTEIYNTIVSGTDRARHAMAQLQPRKFSAQAKTNVQVLRLNWHVLDKLLVMSKQSENKIDLSDTISGPGQLEVNEIDEQGQNDLDWMTKLLQSDLFMKMPTANIQKLFGLLQSIGIEAGDVVIRQGQTNDNYYIIQEGRCNVLRRAKPDTKDIKLAELKAGESFGEESLLMDTTCNATVSMATSGILMKLGKEDFIELIKKPTLQSLKSEQALKLVEQGAIWIDVRFATEYDESHIENSQNIPLNLLRLETSKLDREKHYIIYCDTGGRSSAATFLLAERGFTANYLEGGFISNPDVLGNTDKNASVIDTEILESAKTPEKTDVIDPEIKVTAIDTELECTNMKLKDIERMRKQVSEVQKETRKKLSKDKKSLEAEKKQVLKEANEQKQKEQEKIRKLEKEKKQRVKNGKEKLDKIYHSDTLELAKFHKLKSDFESEMKSEWEQLSEKQVAAEKMLEEASRIKQEVEESRKKLHQENLRKQHEQDEIERKLQMELKEKLVKGQQEITDEILQSDEKLRLAQDENAIAEAARRAARDEAEKIISEFRKKQEKHLNKEEEKLSKERENLELQSIKIQDTLLKLEEEKKRASDEQRVAQKQAAQLARMRLENGFSADKKPLKKACEKKQANMEAAARALLHVEQEEEKLRGEQEFNQQKQEIHKTESDNLRVQMENELMQFSTGQEEIETESRRKNTKIENLQRIQNRAEIAKIESKKATQLMLDEIASQITGTNS